MYTIIISLDKRKLEISMNYCLNFITASTITITDTNNVDC